MAIRNRKTRFAAAVMVLAAGLVPALAAPADGPPAATSSPTAPPQPGWTALCQSAGRSDPLDCRVEQRAVLAGSGQLVAAVTIRVPGDTRRPVLLVRLPLGLSLAGGVTLDVDGKGARSMPLQTCDAGGCYAGSPLPDDFLAAMNAGTTLDLIFNDLQKTPIKLGLPLAGFAAAYEAIK